MDLTSVPWAVDASSREFEVKTTLANRIAGGAMGAVYRASFRRETVAAKTHHAFFSRSRNVRARSQRRS
jgi:hypothetical protein